MAEIHDRRSGGKFNLGDINTEKRQLDRETGRQMVKLFTGDWHISSSPNEMIVTILGSCISACIRDPLLQIGGMNHFLLPGSEEQEYDERSASRYGLFAMETLINGLLKKGAVKERLEFKVFGGGNVLKKGSRIGSRNAAFIRDFLQKEGYPIASSDLEGDYPRRLHYFPDSGKVRMRRLSRQTDTEVAANEERQFNRTLIEKPVEGDIELFS